MNGSLREPVRWSRQRWVHTILAVFALQVGLLLFLGARPGARPVPPRFDTRIWPAGDPERMRQVAALPLFQDPTLYVLPTPHAFSDRAWLSYAPLKHQLSDWSDAPRWLEFSERQVNLLGASFIAYAESVTNAPLWIADLPVPPLTGSDLPVPNRPIGQESRIRLTGDLRTRPLVEPLVLAPWSHAEVLSNTVVKVVVDAEGFPVASTVLAESGLRAADLYALRQTAQARFAPLPHPAASAEVDRRLTWGALVFSWQTLPATNTPAALP